MCSLIQRNTIVFNAASETMRRAAWKWEQNVNLRRMVRHRGTCVIPEFGNLRQRDGEFKACLGYTKEKKKKGGSFPTFHPIESSQTLALTCLA